MYRNNRKGLKPALVLVLALVGGCSGLQERPDTANWPHVAAADPVEEQPEETALEPETAEAAASEVAEREQRIYKGTGRFVGEPGGRSKPVAEANGEFTLNFQNSDLREVVKVILGDMLGLNYVVDPAVQGAVTVQTTEPLKAADLLPALETVLRMNGFTQITTDNTHHILPLGKAARGHLSAQLGDGRTPLPAGHSLRIVPLSYISAAEMAEILTPIAAQGSIIRVDALRNLLVLAGSGSELTHLLDTIDVFDVDWVKGLSVGFFPLAHAKAVEVEAKLRTLLGEQDKGTALQGLFRIAAIESANGLLVVTPQPEYLETVGQWVERLDDIETGTGGDERQLFVYRVKSGEAAGLADLLSHLFDGAAATVGADTGPRIAPGERPVTLSETAGAGSSEGKSPGAPAVRTSGGSAGSRAGSAAAEGIRIVADATRNSLLVTATPREYRKILKALSELDILPLQVMIEATIIEVELQGDLKYGLQWFFQHNPGNNSATGSWDGTLDSAASSGLGSIFPGFNYSVISNASDMRAVFSALAEDSLVEVLSSPSVMVLDNRTARIQVGDQVPIATQQQQTTLTETDRVINTIQYRDTGIVLEVTPRVTPGGLVTIDVNQEVSDVSATRTSNLDSPTITTRRISSSVAVQNGQAVVLGGLIKDRTANSSGGLPGLHKLPGLGFLFGQKSRSNGRTELVVILTPRVVLNPEDARRVTADFRTRMKGLEGAF